MGNKRILAPLSVLTAVTLCLLLAMTQRYPATLSQLLTGRLGTAPAAVTVP